LIDLLDLLFMAIIETSKQACGIRLLGTLLQFACALGLDRAQIGLSLGNIL
jgi:hypothetical protein